MNKIENFWFSIIGLFLCVGLWSYADKVGYHWVFPACGTVYFIIDLLNTKPEKSKSA